MPRTPIPSPAAALRSGRRLRLLAAAIVASGVAGCISPGAELDQAELLLGLSDAVVALRSESAALQEQVDLLEATVARQDSLLRRVAAASGVPTTGP